MKDAFFYASDALNVNALKELPYIKKIHVTPIILTRKAKQRKHREEKRSWK